MFKKTLQITLKDKLNFKKTLTSIILATTLTAQSKDINTIKENIQQVTKPEQLFEDYKEFQESGESKEDYFKLLFNWSQDFGDFNGKDIPKILPQKAEDRFFYLLEYSFSEKYKIEYEFLKDYIDGNINEEFYRRRMSSDNFEEDDEIKIKKVFIRAIEDFMMTSTPIKRTVSKYQKSTSINTDQEGWKFGLSGRLNFKKRHIGGKLKIAKNNLEISSLLMSDKRFEIRCRDQTKAGLLGLEYSFRRNKQIIYFTYSNTF